jgi:hypothetical protein
MYQLSIPKIDRIKACSGTASPSDERPLACPFADHVHGLVTAPASSLPYCKQTLAGG